MRHGLSSFIVLAAFAASAQSHVVLEQPQADAGSTYKAVLRVGHGCGESPVTELVVQIPPGVRASRPMAKPGWQIAVTRSGADVTQIRWSGGRLDPAQYDDFVLLAKLPDQPGPLYWKIAQICESGRADWGEVPAEGQNLRDLKAPAALLDVRPAAAAGAVHQH
ncbi:MAG: YcnI family protein [Burkholderiales bacterium]